MRKKLNDRAVSALRSPTTGRTEVWDTAFPGFGVRVTPNERKSFVLMYSTNGRKRRLTIGTYPALTLANAREKAREALRQIDRGIDPADERAAKRADGAENFGEVLDDYFDSPATKSNRTASQTKRLIERDCGIWLRRPIEAITRRDIRDLLDGVVDRGSPVMANRLRAYLSTFFSWAVGREILEENPVNGVSKPAVEIARDRILFDAELIKVWNAADGLGYPFGLLVQMLILCGQRRGEVAGMRWMDLNLDADDSTWTLAREFTKSDRAHEVPLTPQAAKVLRTIPRFKGPYVFSTRAGDMPISGWSKYKVALDTALLSSQQTGAEDNLAESSQQEALSSWTLHDLRRTTASGMARLGVAPHVIERVLNHSGGVIRGVAAVYNRFDYAD